MSYISTVDAAQDDAMSMVYNVQCAWLGKYTPMHIWPMDDASWYARFKDPMPDGLVGIGQRCGQPDLVIVNSDAVCVLDVYAQVDTDENALEVKRMLVTQ